jgi:hypothetical protein
MNKVFGLTRGILCVTTALLLALGAGGCGENGAGGEDASGLVGDWLQVGLRWSYSNGDTGSSLSRDNVKFFLTFTQSKGIGNTNFRKIGSFWLKSSEKLDMTWRTEGETIYTVENKAGEEEIKYSIDGNTLTLVQVEIGRDYQKTTQVTYKREKISDFERYAGTVHNKDVKLIGTYWGLDEKRLSFEQNYANDRNSRYVNNNISCEWYTENAKLFLLSLECSADSCSNNVSETVELEYEFNNGNLRIRFPGSTVWDTWTPVDKDDLFKASNPIRRSPMFLGLAGKGV